MPAVRALLVLLCGALLSPVAAAQGRTWVRDAAGLWQLEADGTRHAVDERVVSLALRPGADLGALLAGLPAPLSSMTLVRRNRAGVIDLALPAGLDPRDAMTALQADARVIFAEPCTLGSYGGLPDDPLFSQQWHLHNTGQDDGSVAADVSALLAWDITGGDASVVVAVIDSGTEVSHPELAEALWSNPGELPGNGLDDDGNGFVDDVQGWDFAAGDGDVNGVFDHGTSVAGVVAARGDNGVGGAGLAGGGDAGGGCRVMSLAVGNYSPQAALVDDAIVYAADMGARVITLSLTLGSSAAIDAAIVYAHDVRGVFIDCAAGNNGPSVSYPATHALVLAVASSDRDDSVSGFSNRGPEVELTAPGQQILMPALGGGYVTQSGTSFAAPQVAALAALLLSVDASLTPAALRSVMTSTARDLGPAGKDGASGHGRINALAALLAAGGGTPGQSHGYGLGLAGANGAQPAISTPSGPPFVGHAEFKIRLGKAKGGAQAWLLVGMASAALPFRGGTILVDPSGPLFLLPRTVSSIMGAPLGMALASIPVPADAEFVGLSFHVQWVVQDPAAVGGLAMTAGLALLVGG